MNVVLRRPAGAVAIWLLVVAMVAALSSAVILVVGRHAQVAGFRILGGASVTAPDGTAPQSRSMAVRAVPLDEISQVSLRANPMSGAPSPINVRPLVTAIPAAAQTTAAAAPVTVPATRGASSAAGAPLSSPATETSTTGSTTPDATTPDATTPETTTPETTAPSGTATAPAAGSGTGTGGTTQAPPTDAAPPARS